MISLHAQRSSVPPSWSSLTGAQTQVYFQTLPDTDDEDLLAEDVFLNEGKSRGYRFASTHSTSISPVSSGRWAVLENGDRIWLVGVHSKGAKSLGLILEQVYLPQRGLLYIYNEDKTEVYGPITAADNRPSGILTIPHLSGERIIVEYFEPYSERGHGQFVVGRIAHGYRNVTAPLAEDSAAIACHLSTACDVARPYLDVANSIVLITSAEGSKAASGVLINNAGNIEQPYVLTSSDVVEGRASSIMFTFNRSRTACGDPSTSVQEQVITGCDVVVEIPEAGLSLLRLHDVPDHTWDLYYAGWNRNIMETDFGAVLFHPGANHRAVATFEDDWWLSSVDGTPTIGVEHWTDGSTSAGALGAPLFNQNGQIIGIFTNGDGTCGDFEGDYFAPISLAWEELSAYLNPQGGHVQSISGDDVDLKPRDTSIIQRNLAVFPNPASDVVYVFNGNSERLQEVIFYDALGALVHRVTPEDQAIDISMLQAGTYIVEARLSAEVFIRRKLIVR